jgi:hypothetical protein
MFKRAILISVLAAVEVSQFATALQVEVVAPER